MRNVAGIDLGSSWETTGSAILSFNDAGWHSCTLETIAWPASPCDPEAMANAIVSFALRHDVCAIGLDGPSGWRDSKVPGSFVGRECERLTLTPGKTGTFGVVKPGTWISWIQRSIDVFDHLLATGCALLVDTPDSLRLPSPPTGKFFVLESFPTSTWRKSGLDSLPGHGIDLETIQRFGSRLREAFGLPASAVPSESHGKRAHDHLQALVSALPAAALVGGPCRAIPSGLSGRIITSYQESPTHRAEGIIWDAAPIRALNRTSSNIC